MVPWQRRSQLGEGNNGRQDLGGDDGLHLEEVYRQKISREKN